MERIIMRNKALATRHIGSVGATAAWLAVFSLLADVFLPPVRLPGYVAPVSSVVSPLILILCVAAMARRGLRVWWGLWMLMAMGLTAIISTCWSYEVLGVPEDPSDFLEAYKYLQFIPYVIAFQFVNGDVLERVFRKCVLLATPVVLIAGFLQIVEPSGLGLTIANIYGASATQLDNLQNAGNRIMMTGTDPNVGAAICAFFGFYFALDAYDRKKIVSIIVSALFFVLMFMTQSRTAIVAASAAIVGYGLVFSTAKLYVRVGCVALLVVAGWIAMTHLNLQYVLIGFENARYGTNDSLNTRLDNLSQALQWFNQSPWFGWGAAKAIHNTIIDSEYALILERYGVLGATVFGSYIFIYLISSYRRNKDLHKSNILSRCAILYMTFGIVIMATNNLFSGYQLMALVVLLSAGMGSAKDYDLTSYDRGYLPA